MDGKQRQAPPVTNSSIIEVESSWSSSDNTFLVSTPAVTESFEQDTGDSRASKASKVIWNIPFIAYILFNLMKISLFYVWRTTGTELLT